MSYAFIDYMCGHLAVENNLPCSFDLRILRSDEKITRMNVVQHFVFADAITTSLWIDMDRFQTF